MTLRRLFDGVVFLAALMVFETIDKIQTRLFPQRPHED